MKSLATIALLLVITLVSISAYLRLDHSGIGCADWPSCYGQIGAADEQQPTATTTYERLIQEAAQPLSWATPVHRLVASVLGLLILGMALLSLRLRRDRSLSFALLGLTVFLAWLGIYSAGLHSPAIVMGNLGGGFTMLALLGWMVFRHHKPTSNADPSVRKWTVAALLLVAMQIGIGGLTSANFAATACGPTLACNGSWLPGADLATAFDMTRELQISPAGAVIGGAGRADIHKLHRLVAVLALLTSLTAGVLALRSGLAFTAVSVVALVVAEAGVGIAAIMTDLPIALAVAHNWLAAILLLALLRLLALCINRQELLTNG
jgi:cytochrome c oxidase assembly protein subunit 15